MSAAFQLSLLGRSSSPSVDPAFLGLQRHDLGDGAWVDRLPGWLVGHAQVFDHLRESVPWTVTEQTMYDRVVTTPRLVCFDVPAPARPPVLQQISDSLSARYRTALDQLGLALYRDGRDSVAFHTDRDGRPRTRSITAIVSVGEPRPFLLRPKGGGTSRRFTCGWGDLLVMGGTCQREWEHGVPKVANAGPRMAIMYRHAIPVGALVTPGDVDSVPTRPSIQ